MSLLFVAICTSLQIFVIINNIARTLLKIAAPTAISNSKQHVHCGQGFSPSSFHV